MKSNIKSVLSLMLCLIWSFSATASSHREAPLISNDPLADNTDLYAFRSPCDAEKIVIIANYIPFEHPAGGPNWYSFGENIRYEIHIDNDASTPGDDIVYRFTFKHVLQDPSTFFNIRLGQQNPKVTFKCERSMDGGATFTTIQDNGVVPPANIGPRSIESPVGLGAPSYDNLMMAAIANASSGERLFCGPVDDPFFVDLGGAFDLGAFRPEGQARDGLAKFNCHSIALEIPISTLQKDGKTGAMAANILDGDYVIGVWASASRPAMSTLSMNGETPTTSGDWVQVSRLGMPLTNEVVIPVGQKDAWNGTSPYNGDLAFAANFTNPELGLYMDDSAFGGAVPGLSPLRIQSASLGSFDFRNGKKGLFDLKGSPALDGTALSEAAFGSILLPDSTSPRAVDLLPIFYTGVPNLRPYQLATGKNGNPLAAGKPFINNFLPSLGDMLRLNMAVPATPRNHPQFSSLGIVNAAVLGLTDPTYAGNANMQWIPNMDGFPNGRRLEDDVTTIELQAVSGVALAAIGLWYDDYVVGGSPVTPDLLSVLTFNAGVTKNDTTFKQCFPYLQTPWRGFTGPSYVGPTVSPVNYCTSNSSNTTKHHITKVALGAINNPSGNSVGGYSDFTSQSTVLTQGVASTIVLRPGTSSIVNWRVYIDYNKDGDFTDIGETVAFASGSGTKTRTFIVPTNSTVGATRMRVIVRKQSSGSIAPCGTYSNGETEDYSVDLQPNNCVGIPMGWTHSTIGGSTASGTVCETNGTWTSTTCANDFVGTNDYANFVYKSLTGNGEIVARVNSLQNTGSTALAGIMMRATTQTNSAHASIYAHPSKIVSRVRNAQFETSSGSDYLGTAPLWLKITRNGNNFRTFTSTDGVSYTLRKSYTVVMPSTILVGLLGASGSTSNCSEAIYTNVMVTNSGTFTSDDATVSNRENDGALLQNANRQDLGEMTVYPNPTSDRVYISLPTGTEEAPEAVLYITDVLGRVLQTVRYGRDELKSTQEVVLNGNVTGQCFFVLEAQGQRKVVNKILVVK